MAPAPPNERHGNRRSGFNPISSFIQSTTSTLSSFLSPKPLRAASETTPFASVVSTTNSGGGGSTPRVLLSLPLANSPVTLPTRDESSSMKPPDSVATAGNSLDYDAGFPPSTFKIGRMSSAGKGGGGPAFVGQVFSMCDLTGTGLMAVSTHFDIPFLSKRTPEWMKKMLQRVVKSDNGPVFRFFMDLGDAVAYVKQLNIPSGIVGACRLDLAYEHFKEKPHLFQFIPNEKQVKQANKLLKKIPGTDTRKIDGVPVFSAQNLDIAIATTDGIKYTPYFFDKSTLDNILEESIDQHFNALIQSRHMHRRRDVMDDNLPAEVSEETAESMWEPAEVQELLDEVGYPEIPFSVITKAAEVQLMYAVDRLLLGNKWLRKATGIQPKVPYMVDSFQKRSAASLLRASEASDSVTNMESGQYTRYLDDHRSSKPEAKGDAESPCSLQNDFRFPFGDWGKHPWSNPQMEKQNGGHLSNLNSLEQCKKKEMQVSPLLPNVTMVGISTSEPGQMSKATLKKTMEKLTKELEQDGQVIASANSISIKPNHEDRDPLFVANVGSYYSGLVKTNPTRWVHSGNN
ncbi:hypothetical protein V2J09_003203 [Rumex salicifolius]